MMFETHTGGLANLNLAVHIDIAATEDPNVRQVYAKLGCAHGDLIDGCDAIFDLYDVIMFQGTQAECEDYMAWLKREYDVQEYSPDWADGLGD